MQICLAHFSHIRPPFEHPQESILDWIAKAHARAEKNAHGNVNEEFFYHKIKERLDKIGLGNKKIAKRGTHKEVLNTNWDELDISAVSQGENQTQLGARTRYFDEASSLILEKFYEGKALLPAYLVHVTCTGYVSPSPAQKIVSNKKASCMVTHAYHMGCYASIPAIRMAQGYLHAGNNQEDVADIVHTEMCSLHMDPLAHGPEQLVVQSLFGDGFIKYSLVTNQDVPRLEILSLYEAILPDTIQDMSWRMEESGMRMTLSKDVPQVIAKGLDSFLEVLINRTNLDAEMLKKEALFAVHPGGSKIIEQIKDILDLSEEQIEESQDVLKNFGNMSSATLPHIWEKMINKAPNGRYIVSLAFGPGLTICGALFQLKGK